MRFNFYYHKTASLFRFIASLSNWSLGCSPHFNADWIKKTDSLTPKETDILKKIAAIVPRYERMPEAKSYLEFLFLTPEEKTIWGKVGNLASKDDLKILEEVFKVFEPRFNTIWREEENNLRRWCEELKEFSKDSKLQLLEKDLRTFFQSPEPELKLNVCLLPSTRGAMAGDNIGYPTVAIKCSAAPLEKRGDVMAILYHESSHAFWERPLLHELVSKFLDDLKEPFPKLSFAVSRDALWTALGEATVSNLFPEGYLAYKYLEGSQPQMPKKGSSSNFANWRVYCAAQMFNTTRHYIKSQRHLDAKYISEVWRNLKDFAHRYSNG